MNVGDKVTVISSGKTGTIMERAWVVQLDADGTKHSYRETNLKPTSSPAPRTEVVFSQVGKTFTVAKAWDRNTTVDWVNDTGYTNPAPAGTGVFTHTTGGETRLALNPRKYLSMPASGWHISMDATINNWGLRDSSDGSWAGLKFWAARQQTNGDTTAEGRHPGLYTVELLRYNTGQAHLLQKKAEGSAIGDDSAYHYLANPGRTGFAVQTGRRYHLESILRVLDSGSVELRGLIDGLEVLRATDTGTVAGAPYNSKRGPYTCGFRSDWCNWRVENFQVTGL